MKGRNPNKKEKEHMDRVQQLGCIVCRNEYEVFSPAEIHHVYGKTKKNAHFYVLPLCFRHHREGINCDLFASRHPFKTQFELRYGKEEDLLEQVQELLGQELITL